MNTTPHIPTTHPVQLGKDLLSAEACDILQQGIRAALIDEAMQWTGDARVEVWMAIINAAQRMGLEITKDELYRRQIELRGARSVEPAQRHEAHQAPAFLWNGQRPAYTITRSDPPLQEQDHGPL